MALPYKVTKEQIFRSLLYVWHTPQQRETGESQEFNASQCSQSLFGETVERSVQTLNFRDHDAKFVWPQTQTRDSREQDDEDPVFRQIIPTHERDCVSFDALTRHQNVTVALSYIARLPSRTVYLSTTLLYKIIVFGILKASCLPPIRRAVQLLSDATRKHPPKDAAMRDHYLTIFRFQPDGDNKPFEYLRCLIGGCLGNREIFQIVDQSTGEPPAKKARRGKPVLSLKRGDVFDIDAYIGDIGPSAEADKVEEISEKQRCLEMLRFLSQLLSDDFKFWSQKPRNPLVDLRSSKSSPMIARIIWSDGLAGTINSNCKALFNLFLQALIQKDVPLIEEISNLVAMVGEVSFLSDIDSTQKIHLPRGNARAFATSLEISLQEMLVEVDDVDSVLLAIKPAWLKMEIADRCLSNFDERWTRNMKLKELFTTKWDAFGVLLGIEKQTDGFKNGAPGSPVLSSSNSSASKSRTPLRSRGQNGEVPPPPLKIDNPGSNIGGKREIRKNSKGETRLHTACQKGESSVVRDLLATPGVDVNARDNAGWTPLHDASWKGTPDCIRLLLNHKVHTLMPFFRSSKVHSKDGAVDILAVGVGGRTALHLAAEYGHADVATILLKKGGDSLFDLRTDTGLTAEDLGRSPTIRDLFRSYRERRDEDFFQSSQGLSQGLSQNLLDSPLTHRSSQRLPGSPMKIRPSEVQVQAKSDEKVKVCVQYYASAYVSYFRFESVDAAFSLVPEEGTTDIDEAMKLFSDDFSFVTYYQDLRVVRERLIGAAV